MSRKNLFIVFVCVILGIMLVVPVIAKKPKVTLCHIPNGNPLNAHTIEVAEPAVPEHLAHGDLLGACPTSSDGELACMVYNMPNVFAFYDVESRTMDPLVNYTSVLHSLDDLQAQGIPASLNYWFMGGHWTQLFNSSLPPNVNWRASSPNCSLCAVPAMHLVVENANGEIALIEPPESPPAYSRHNVYDAVDFFPEEGACRHYSAGAELRYNEIDERWELNGSPIINDSNDGSLIKDW
jgi:hypothetical protein